MKICSKCQQNKDISCFGKWKFGKDGYRHYCKKCRKEEHAAHYLINKSKINERHKKYRVNNKDKVKEQCRLYSIKYKDRIHKTHRTWYLKNKDKKLEQNKQWYKNNPEKRKKIQINKANKRRARIRQVEENFKDYDTVYKLFNNCCFRCKSVKNLTIDHHKPLSKGNPLSLKNAVLLCKSCNSSKGARDPQNFYNIDQLLELNKILDKANSIMENI